MASKKEWIKPEVGKLYLIKDESTMICVVFKVLATYIDAGGKAVKIKCIYDVDKDKHPWEGKIITVSQRVWFYTGYTQECIELKDKSELILYLV